MARRSGQVGYEKVKRGWYHVRFRMDLPGQEKRAYLSRPICPVSGPGSLTKPERLKLRKEIIAASGADTKEHFNKVEAFNHGVTFRKQAEWWLNHAQTRKRKPIKPATALGFTSYLNKWLYPNLGDLPLSSVNNLPIRSLVANMTRAGMSPKMVNNVIQVVKMVVSSAVNESGEELHANKSVTDLYSKLKEDVTFRKTVAEQVGIGFELPAEKPEVAPNCTHTELLSHVA